MRKQRPLISHKAPLSAQLKYYLTLCHLSYIYIYIYMSYRTANLQTLHFKIFIQQMSVLNILNMLHNLRFSLFKIAFIS
jgi:hypothetical protein